MWAMAGRISVSLISVEAIGRCVRCACVVGVLRMIGARPFERSLARRKSASRRDSVKRCHEGSSLECA